MLLRRFFSDIIADMASNRPLEILSSEADSLLEQAKTYRREMDELPDGDPRREVLARVIRDLLERSQKLNREVIATVKST